jgi:tetratricopeptide (TPR) repeat protein
MRAVGGLKFASTTVSPSRVDPPRDERQDSGVEKDPFDVVAECIERGDLTTARSRAEAELQDDLQKPGRERTAAVRALRALGLIDAAQERWSDARGRFEAGLRMLPDGDSRRAVLQADLANVSAAQGDAGAARAALEHAVAEIEDRDGDSGAAVVPLLGALAVLELGDDGAGRKRAQSLAARALDLTITSAGEDAVEVGDVLLFCGLLQAGDDLRGARALTARAGQIYRRRGQRHREAVAALVEARLDAGLGASAAEPGLKRARGVLGPDAQLLEASLDALSARWKLPFLNLRSIPGPWEQFP